MSKKLDPPSQETVNNLLMLYKSQQYGDAVKGAQKFSQQWPNYGFGWNMLAASFYALEKREESAEAYRRALTVEPENPEAQNNYGNVLRELGQLKKSASALRIAVKLNPQFSQAYYNLGLTLLPLGEISEAEKSFNMAISIDPEFADAHNYLGNIYKSRTEYDLAVGSYKKATEILPSFAEAHSNLGGVFSNLGRYNEAEKSIRRALEISPWSADILAAQGDLFLRQNRYDEAEKAYRDALLINPEFTQSRNNLGIVLRSQGKLNQSEVEFRRALANDNGAVSILQNLGNVVLDLGRLDEGRGYFEKIVALDPNSASAHRNLGVTLAILGDSISAARSYRNSIQINPEESETYYRLSEVKKFDKFDDDVLLIENQLSVTDKDPNKLAFLNYAAGKAYADIGEDMDKSFNHYRKGALARRLMIDYDVKYDEKHFKQIADVYSKELVEKTYGKGYECQAAIFVVGMPRSGTTLVEHILASHRDTHGAGERFDVERLVENTGKKFGLPYPDWVQEFSDSEYVELGSNYWQGIKETAPEAKKIIDKMPNNFRYTGLIAGMLSGARIIHVKRNPLDTCVSCFTHLFEDAQKFSYEFNELGKFYRAYSKLMTHWRAVLPSELYFEVQYEDLVYNPEESIKNMLAHCELDWDPNCLDFYNTKRVVPTASLVQVRQPLYKTAIGRWNQYAAKLRPLIDELGDLVDDSTINTAVH